MSVLDRYIVRTILGTVALVMAVLLVLGALFVFIDQQSDVGIGHYTALGALWYSLLNLPQQAYELLPITALLGSLLGLGTLARGSELTVMRSTASLIHSKDPAERAELHWRISMPIMCLVLALLAVPLSRLRPRQGRYSRVWVAVVIFFVYYNLATTARTWIARGTLPEWVGLWWTHVAVTLLALAVILGPRIANRVRYRMRGL